MPNVPLTTFRLGDTALGIVEYNDANRRISRFYWQNISPGCVVTVVIWDTNDPAYPAPIFNGSFTGDGSQAIPGNYQAIQDPTDPDGSYMIPPNIIVRFSMLCSGA